MPLPLRLRLAIFRRDATFVAAIRVRHVERGLFAEGFGKSASHAAAARRLRALRAPREARAATHGGATTRARIVEHRMTVATSFTLVERGQLRAPACSRCARSTRGRTPCSRAPGASAGCLDSSRRTRTRITPSSDGSATTARSAAARSAAATPRGARRTGVAATPTARPRTASARGLTAVRLTA